MGLTEPFHCLASKARAVTAESSCTPPLWGCARRAPPLWRCTSLIAPPAKQLGTPPLWPLESDKVHFPESHLRCLGGNLGEKAAGRTTGARNTGPMKRTQDKQDGTAKRDEQTSPRNHLHGKKEKSRVQRRVSGTSGTQWRLTRPSKNGKASLLEEGNGKTNDGKKTRTTKEGEVDGAISSNMESQQEMKPADVCRHIGRRKKKHLWYKRREPPSS